MSEKSEIRSIFAFSNWSFAITDISSLQYYPLQQQYSLTNCEAQCSPLCMKGTFIREISLYWRGLSHRFYRLGHDTGWIPVNCSVGRVVDWVNDEFVYEETHSNKIDWFGKGRGSISDTLTRIWYTRPMHAGPKNIIGISWYYETMKQFFHET